MTSNCDLIKTIEDDQEVPNYSENSDEEDDVSYINESLYQNNASYSCYKHFIFIS